MAFKGTAGKSSTGASMSKYDVEVEERLQVLESKGDPVVGGAAFDQLSKLEEKLAAVSAADAVSLNTRVTALEEQLSSLIDILNTVPQVVDHAPKSSQSGSIGGRAIPNQLGTSSLG